MILDSNDNLNRINNENDNDSPITTNRNYRNNRIIPQKNNLIDNNTFNISDINDVDSNDLQNSRKECTTVTDGLNVSDQFKDYKGKIDIINNKFKEIINILNNAVKEIDNFKNEFKNHIKE